VWDSCSSYLNWFLPLEVEGGVSVDFVTDKLVLQVLYGLRSGFRIACVQLS
jgi:hypothetical protein